MTENCKKILWKLLHLLNQESNREVQYELSLFWIKGMLCLIRLTYTFHHCLMAQPFATSDFSQTAYHNRKKNGAILKSLGLNTCSELQTFFHRISGKTNNLHPQFKSRDWFILEKETHKHCFKTKFPFGIIIFMYEWSHLPRSLDTNICANLALFNQNVACVSMVHKITLFYHN